MVGGVLDSRVMVSQFLRQQSKKELIDGFIVDSSQTTIAKWIFERYPETALHVRSQNLQHKTIYMDILLDIFLTLSYKKSCDISQTDLWKASEGLSDLTQAGFKVGWLRAKLNDVSLNVCEARIVKLNDEIKKLELMMSDLKIELKKEVAKLKML